MWCETCRKYEDGITGIKNFSRAWIVGSSNQKTSNIVDHATSEQHHAAMTRVRADTARASHLPLTSYSPIAHSLLVMDEAVQGWMKKKFDICYVMAKESLSFRKYSALRDTVLILAWPTRMMFQQRPSPTTLVRVSAKAFSKAFPPQTSTVFSWMVPLTRVMWKMSWY